jgi:hypothetical protein
MRTAESGDDLRRKFSSEIADVESAVAAVPWTTSFRCEHDGNVYEHQAGYNKAFGVQFSNRGWQPFPILLAEPKLIGDFRKGQIFVEIQFGNSATLYRDYYKFQYGVVNGLVSLAVLIVPYSAKAFFPTRLSSVHHMAEYASARHILTVLPTNVPLMLIGLLPGTS